MLNGMPIRCETQYAENDYGVQVNNPIRAVCTIPTTNTDSEPHGYKLTHQLGNQGVCTVIMKRIDPGEEEFKECTAPVTHAVQDNPFEVDVELLPVG
ncbi:hypothetical protein ACGFWI_17005 [Streptomyces sp. NPDC048434]|uniref:hypothetical protein n=1 Tax=Streptomyces sp. NPDC048434 TaxID=3365549 RepID=UPI00371CD266